MDNGLTREEAAETVTQLAFYTGVAERHLRAAGRKGSFRETRAVGFGV